MVAHRPWIFFWASHRPLEIFVTRTLAEPPGTFVTTNFRLLIFFTQATYEVPFDTGQPTCPELACRE